MISIFLPVSFNQVAAYWLLWFFLNILYKLFYVCFIYGFLFIIKRIYVFYSTLLWESKLVKDKGIGENYKSYTSKLDLFANKRKLFYRWSFGNAIQYSVFLLFTRLKKVFGILIYFLTWLKLYLHPLIQFFKRPTYT